MGWQPGVAQVRIGRPLCPAFVLHLWRLLSTAHHHSREAPGHWPACSIRDSARPGSPARLRASLSVCLPAQRRNGSFLLPLPLTLGWEHQAETGGGDKVGCLKSSPRALGLGPGGPGRAEEEGASCILKWQPCFRKPCWGVPEVAALPAGRPGAV